MISNIQNTKNFLPEGFFSLPEDLCKSLSDSDNSMLFQSLYDVQESINSQKILESRAIVCDNQHNLIVDLGCIKGIIPKDDCAIGISDGSIRDIAIISKVNKPVCFVIKKIVYNEDKSPYAILSRKEVQQKCYSEYINSLRSGDIINAKITHLESFGCFVDIGCGIISLIPIDSISVSRISHSKDRFKVGQNIKCVVKNRDADGKIFLSHKELLGSWEENAANFSAGETVAGTIRSIETYGVFIELSPNLAGLAELKDDVKIGQQASVYIKSIIPEKMKIKLIIVDNFDSSYFNFNYNYFIKDTHIDYWKYSPDSSPKLIHSIF